MLLGGDSRTRPCGATADEARVKYLRPLIGVDNLGEHPAPCKKSAFVYSQLLDVDSVGNQVVGGGLVDLVEGIDVSPLFGRQREVVRMCAHVVQELARQWPFRKRAGAIGLAEQLTRCALLLPQRTDSSATLDCFVIPHGPHNHGLVAYVLEGC